MTRFPFRFVGLVLVLVTLGRAQPMPVPPPTHPGAGQTFYFVLTDRFANGNPANDTGGHPGGPEEHGFDPGRIGYYHGGDFAGLTARLDYLKDLGVTAVWVTPPFTNKPVQAGSAGYHGYWILDFLHVDPHLGTDAAFKEFVQQAHRRGLKVYMDIVVNHTADVIHYQGGSVAYIDEAAAPYRDAAGRPFDERTVAFNGVGPDSFPALSAAKSFPYVPVVPAEEVTAKNPAWLNDPVHYHNRGNSTFAGESSTLGDFSGLDDLFTEDPAVVRGFIDIYRQWIEACGLDGFRIDTARHVNLGFWQAFCPAIRAAAAQAGRPDFLQFGEVSYETDIPSLSAYSTQGRLDATLDFGFFRAAQNYVSKVHSGAELADFFALDDYYTDHDRNVQASTIYLGNHDAGRFAYFLQRDNPDAPPAELVRLVELGHGLLFLVRGQPVIYYGDEQGMIGRGGGDMQAREDMFAAQAPDFKNAPLLGTTRTGADDKFDENHPLYRMFRALATLRTAHPALNRGAMITRPTNEAALFAFSRVDRRELVEYLAVFNNSRTATLAALVPTSQPAGAGLKLLYSSPDMAAPAGLVADPRGRVAVTLGPLQFALWQANAVLPAQAGPLTVKLTGPTPDAVLAVPAREVDNQVLPLRPEIKAEVSGNDGVAEVTFALQRKSRPGQYELLGVDDAAPYRVFWNPPPDLAPGEELTFTATVSDLRGREATSTVGGVKVAPLPSSFGIKGATTPVLTSTPPPLVRLADGASATLTVTAKGTAPLEYQWLRDGAALPGATNASLSVTQTGHYAVLVRNRAGTALSHGTTVTAGRIETHASVASHFVAPRRVDVWLPPGYDANPAARYPVIYMHDGQNLFDPATSYIGVAWSVDEAMLRLIAAGRARGAIVVGIWNTPARLAEYLPQKAVAAARLAEIAEFAGQPDFPLQADAYLRFMVEELKPFIDRTYRTQPDAPHTFSIGSSMGGLISAYAVTEYPQVFGGAGCLSSSWQVGHGAVVDYLAAHLPKAGAHRFYIDAGAETQDAAYLGYETRLLEALRRAGYTEGRDWLSRNFPGAEHSERSWRKRVDFPLTFLLGQ